MKVTGNIQSAQQLQAYQLDANQAQSKLSEIAKNLTDANGRIKSGYLRLTDSGSLNAGHRFFSRGSHSQATGAIREMVRQAYEGSVGTNTMRELEAAMDTYLGKSGGAIGTKSLVKMVRALEAKVGEDHEPSLGNIQSRLAMPEIMLQKDETQLATAIDQQVADLRGKRQSPISDSALKQFQSLANAMSWHAKPIPNGDQQVMTWHEQFMAFDNLVFPSVSKLNPADAVASPEAPRTFAMGDADGSMGRMWCFMRLPAVWPSCRPIRCLPWRA